MVERGVYAAGACEAHEVDRDIIVFGVFESSDDLRIGLEGAVGYGAVDLDEILVYDAAGADVEMAYLGVAHLPVGQADIFADAVAVENYQQCFLAHILFKIIYHMCLLSAESVRGKMGL